MWTIGYSHFLLVDSSKTQKQNNEKLEAYYMQKKPGKHADYLGMEKKPFWMKCYDNKNERENGFMLSTLKELLYAGQ